MYGTVGVVYNKCLFTGEGERGAKQSWRLGVNQRRQPELDTHAVEGCLHQMLFA